MKLLMLKISTIHNLLASNQETNLRREEFCGFLGGINRNRTKAKGNLGIRVRVRVWFGAEAALSSLQESNPECICEGM